MSEFDGNQSYWEFLCSQLYALLMQGFTKETRTLEMGLAELNSLCRVYSKVLSGDEAHTNRSTYIPSNTESTIVV